MNSPIISMENINKSYSNSKFILQNLNLQVYRNDMVVIKGNSGCGKSTLLNIIGLLDSFDSGTYKINGEVIKNDTFNKLNRFRAQNIGFIFQAYQLLDGLSVIENISLPLIYSKGRIREEQIDLINTLINKFQLEDLKNTKAKYLSGGEKQRVAIARAVIRQPEIIIADEPTGNLDEENTSIIINYLKSYADMGKCVIIVTHNKEVLTNGQKKYILTKGELYEC